MNRKVKSFKQCFYQNKVRFQKLQQLSEVKSFGLDTSRQLFYRSSAQTSTVSGVCVSRYCCYRNRAAGSKPS